MRDELLRGAPTERARAAAERALSEPGVADYFDAVDAATFEALDRVDRAAFVVGAARFGTTRLIDNLLVEPNG